MISARTQNPRHLVVLGLIAVGLLMLLVVPALASAQAPAAPAAPAAQETSPDPAAAEPAAAEPAPADEATPPVAEEPAPTEPAAPPAATEPAPTPAPAPPGDPGPTSPVISDTPAAPAAPAEASPDNGPTLVLPDAPATPGAVKVAAGPDRADAPPPDAPPPLVTPIAAPSAPPDAPMAPTPATRPDPVAADATPLPGTELITTLGPDRAPDALTLAEEAEPGPAGQDEDAAGNPFATFGAPDGAVPAGSSLLAVLASYAIPGSGLPSTTLLLFVQLALILAAFYAPRSGIGERLVALGRLGPRHGYRTVLARPG